MKKQIRGSNALQKLNKLESDTSSSVQFEYLEHNERIEVVLKAMSLLEEREQLVIQMQYFEDKPLQVIADELGLSLEATKKISQQAIIKIKKFVPL